MDRMLVVICREENKTEEAKRALLRLDRENRISIYAYALVGKNVNGTVTVKEAQDFGPLGTFVGTALANLVSVFDHPIAAFRSTTGIAPGRTAHPNHVRLGGDFIDDVAELFVPWTFAVFAEVDEHWTTPVDAQMEIIGGTVLRRALSHLDFAPAKQDVAAIKADLAQLKAEHDQANGDRKEKLQEKLNQLNSRLQVQLQRAKDLRQATEREAQTKVQVLLAKKNQVESNAA
jgi:uncharacterized membrane protein